MIADLDDETLSVHSFNNSRSYSRPVMYKAFAYSSAWLLSYGFWFLGSVLEMVDGSWPLACIYLTNVFVPLQGFFNLIIYMLPKVTAAKKCKRGNISGAGRYIKHSGREAVDEGRIDAQIFVVIAILGRRGIVKRVRSNSLGNPKRRGRSAKSKYLRMTCTRHSKCTFRTEPHFEMLSRVTLRHDFWM